MRLILTLMIITSTLFASDTVVEGKVTINGKKATAAMKVNLNDFIETGKASKVMFRINDDAFLAKEKTKMSIKEGKNGIKTLNVITGGVLGVFKKGSKYDLKTNNMTAGVRGTGIYLEKVDKKSYFCTCYGSTQVHSNKAHQKLHATHHNMVWIKPDGTIKPAKEMRDHSDDELRALEKMVGRVPDFDKPKKSHEDILKDDSGY